MSSAGKSTIRLSSPDDVWEYDVVHVHVSDFFGVNVDAHALNRMLNASGKDGWELVNTIDINTGHGATAELIFFFKRLYRPDRYPQPD